MANLDHRAAHTLIPSAVLTALAIICIVARLCTRCRLVSRVQLSDCAAAAAMVCSVVFFAFIIAETKSGMGRHDTDYDPDTLTRLLKIFWISLPFYNLAMVLGKTSILLQYCQVFQIKTISRLCKTMIAALTMYGLWAILSTLLRCIPVAKLWRPESPGYCLPNDILWLINTGVYIVIDLIVVIIPVLGMFSLHFLPQQKVALCTVFALGGLVLIISILRLGSIRDLSLSVDFIHDSPTFSMWSSIECNTGIICACLPTFFHPFLSRCWPTIVPDLHTTPPQTRPSSRTLTYRTRQTHPADSVELERLRQDSRTNSANYHNVNDYYYQQQQQQCRRFPMPGNAFAEDLYRNGTLFRSRDEVSDVQ